MGNAIRQLKLEISGSDIDLPEQDAKDALCHKIDHYIRDRIIIADQVIQDIAVKKIKDGDIILTYARSSVVEKVLLRAFSEGKDFSVIVVDSRPLLEGKKIVIGIIIYRHPMFLSFTPSSRLSHYRGLDRLRRRSLSPLQWRCFFSCWNGFSRHDG
jgi:hypothetical protein